MTKLIQDLNFEEKYQIWSRLVFDKFWVENPVMRCIKEHLVVIKFILYKLCILSSFQGFRVVLVIHKLTYVGS